MTPTGKIKKNVLQQATSSGESIAGRCHGAVADGHETSSFEGEQ
jgi:hypothetical protein